MNVPTPAEVNARDDATVADKLAARIAHAPTREELRRASRDALEACGDGIIAADEARALGQLILGTVDHFDRGDAA